MPQECQVGGLLLKTGARRQSSRMAAAARPEWSARNSVALLLPMERDNYTPAGRAAIFSVEIPRHVSCQVVIRRLLR
jgi:hypothetical protein